MKVKRSSNEKRKEVVYEAAVVGKAAKRRKLEKLAMRIERRCASSSGIGLVTYNG